MNLDRLNALEFMLGVNKEARKFIQKNYISMKNAFINEGLIVHALDNSNVSSYEWLERLYF